jgi:hypothetical protein
LVSTGRRLTSIGEGNLDRPRTRIDRLAICLSATHWSVVLRRDDAAAEGQFGR